LERLSVGFLEVLEISGGCGTHLTVILAPQLLRAIGALGRRTHLEQTELTDLHTRIEGDWQVGHVGQLESQVAIEASIHETGGIGHKNSSTPGEEVFDSASSGPNFEVKDRLLLPRVSYLDNTIPSQIALSESPEPRERGRTLSQAFKSGHKPPQRPEPYRVSIRTLLNVAQIGRGGVSELPSRSDLVPTQFLAKADQQSIRERNRGQELVFTVRNGDLEQL
jgi:hypothetical protein